MAGNGTGRDGSQALLWRIAGVLTALSVMGLGFLLVSKRSYEPPQGAADEVAEVDLDAAPVVHGASPRRISNQASYPLMVYGEGFAPDDAVWLVGPRDGAARPLPTTYVDAGHLTTRIPAAIGLPTNKTFGALAVQVRRPSGLTSEGQASLVLVNDATYPVPAALEATEDGTRVFVASPTTDALWFVDVSPDPGAEPSRPQPVPVGDGPRALARVDVGDGGDRLVVLHELAPELWLIPMDEPRAEPRVVRVEGAIRMQDLAIVGRGEDAVAFVSSRGTNRVLGVRLRDGEVVRELETPPNPGPIAATANPGRPPGEAAVCVSSLGADLVHCDRVDGIDRSFHSNVGDRGTILGGGTAPLAEWVMGGKAARDLVFGPDQTIVATSIGPNLGPNPDRVEVSMNGGLTVIADRWGREPLHVSMGTGVPQGIGIVGDRILIADVGRGRVVSAPLDLLKRLEGVFGSRRVGPFDLDRARPFTATPIPPPRGTTMLRPADELGVDGRAGPELHSGPWAIVPAGRDRVYVLGRLSGHVTELRVPRRVSAPLEVIRSFPVMPFRAQPQRRLGEVAYYTDVGNSRMSCDTCHVQGREGGLLFTKGDPMHIYRTPTLLSIAESPPYFTPAMFPSLAATAQIVLSRNRFHNPDASPIEVRALGMFQAALVEPPNPFRGPNGELPAVLGDPGDGDTPAGNPTRGLALFEGKADCATCHPAPSFTTDQDEATRGRTHDVGTPNTLPLRLEMQDGDPYPLPPPSLLGVWDHFPLLDSGAGGYGVVPAEPEGGPGAHVAATHPDAIRRVLDLAAESEAHGQVHELSPEERRDLAAYLRTL